MFNDLEKNREMLLGAYKKVKSYYHYNKNFVFMKQKVAKLEYDYQHMLNTIDKLAKILAYPNVMENSKSINAWIEKINFYIMPKSFINKEENNDLFITGNLRENKSVNKVNFFIDMPIELHLLDALWTVLIGKLVFEKELISSECYGNCIDNYVLYNNQKDYLDSINFSKNKLFKIYFPQYCKWKNDAIRTVEEKFYLNKSQILFSLDIKGFFYSVFWKFTILDDIFGEDSRYKELIFLTKIIQKIFERYTNIIRDYRIVKQEIEKQEYVLPIGLFSSMLLANIYMIDFDKMLKDNPKVLHYGRYVDDIIIVIDVSGDERNVSDRTAFDKYLVEDNHILEYIKGDRYAICNLSTLFIQKEKVKMIYFDKNDSPVLIDQMKKAITYPSQMNVIPETELSIVDFEEAAYAKTGIGTETKIRDIGKVQIDKFQLGWHMSQVVINNRIKKQYITRDEKIRRQKEGDSILRFFTGSKALEYSSNWINAMYYFLLTADTNRNAWKQFEYNIRSAIKELTADRIEDLKKGKKRNVVAILKRDLKQHFDICAATVLALYPKFSKKENKEIVKLAIQLRKANLFNHYLVSFPLINYSDNLDENCDLTSISPDKIRDMKLMIQNSQKSKLSPRFINLDEIYQFVFLRQCTKGGNYYQNTDKWTVEDKLNYIEDYFYYVNQINKSTVDHIAISIDNIENQGYILQKIKLGDVNSTKGNVKIAIANIKLDTKRCCFGLKCAENVTLNRLDLIAFMNRTYMDGRDKVDFLVFPEFYMPLQWISEVLAFVRKSGITVISGLQYVTYNGQAYNNVALFAPVKTGRYLNAVLLVREKNDYAPMERELLAIEKYRCINQAKPVYQVVNCDGIDYGIFLCYEFTDIVARSLYKDKVDIIFTPEHNRDTSYFANIIETTARDLHVFIVQANTSIYGDSRITGPYGRNDRNVIQIKGGDRDDIIVGTIELGKLRKYQQEEKDKFNKKIQEYLGLGKRKVYELERQMFAEHELKIAKTSARFGKENI
ncbi:MAG: reverse transcriptase domain-containing protein [Candidatus Gastranaerophilales bacterium]|nr:reverse transcriptase domain-containing protein [Candidatus Gastranaerophilales bacterium]